MGNFIVRWLFAQQLQSMGRNSDTILAHITPAEAQLLNDVTDGGSINPDTGLPEFFFGELFSGMSDSFSSIGTSLSENFSSFGDSISSFGDSFSSGLSEIGNSFSNGFSDTFGDNVSKLGDGQDTGLDTSLSSNLDTSLSAGMSDTLNPSKLPESSNFDGVMDNLKPSEAALPQPTLDTPSLSPPKLGMGEGQALGVGEGSTGLGFGETPKPALSQMPKKVPLTLDQKIEATVNDLNAKRVAEIKAKPTLSQQQTLKSVIKDMKAKQPQGTASFNRPTRKDSPNKFWKSDGAPAKGGNQNYLQRGPSSDANAKPLGTAPALTPEADASNARLAAASVKTTNHTALKRDVTDALKTGGNQAQAEVHDLTQKMDALNPGSGTKLANDVGLKPQSHPGLPPRKPEPPLDAVNKMPNGEPYKFKVKEGIDGGKLPPAMVSPTDSGEIRKQDGHGDGKYQASREGGSRLHKGVDFVAKPNEDIKSSVSGKVVNVSGKPYKGSDYKIVDIETSDGYIVRHFYVSPSLKKGDSVKAGKTIIGKAQNIASKQGNDGMTNHVHIEIREPLISAYTKTGLKRFKDINPNNALMKTR